MFWFKHKGDNADLFLPEKKNLQSFSPLKFPCFLRKKDFNPTLVGSCKIWLNTKTVALHLSNEQDVGLSDVNPILPTTAGAVVG